ncbi:unnamed protein product [Closterium sp. NIES-54]
MSQWVRSSVLLSPPIHSHAPSRLNSFLHLPINNANSFSPSPPFLRNLARQPFSLLSTSSTSPSCHLDSRFFLSPSPASVSASSVAIPLLLSPPSPPPRPTPLLPSPSPPHTADISFRFSPLFPVAFISMSPLPLPGSLVSHPIFQAYDAAISFLASLLHVNSSCASLPASSRPSLTWTRPSTPTPAALIPHTTSSTDPTPYHNPHSSQPSSLTDAEAAAVGAAVEAAVAEAQNPPWECVPDLPAVDWPRLRWQFDWPTFMIHATSDRKPLAVRAWTGRTRPGSKRRDFRFIVKQGLTGCMVPFKSAPGSYIAKFGTLCVQPILFLLHTVSPPALQPDGLWYFNSSIRDIPKVGYRALFIEVDFKHGPYHKPIVLTTESMIAPNTFPFAPCNSTACLTEFA